MQRTNDGISQFILFLGIFIGLSSGSIIGFFLGQRHKKNTRNIFNDMVAHERKNDNKKIKTPKKSKTSTKEIESLKQNLRVKCLHNEELVNRLIQIERKKYGNENEATLIQAAIISWEKDNR